MRTAAVFAALGILVGAFASIAFGVLRGDADETTIAEFEIEPVTAGGPRGAALVRHRGGRLTGWVIVSGLDPGTRHAVHFHGPNSSCGNKADPVAIHPDLEADSGGVAIARVDIAVPTDILRPGYYYNVHAEDSTAADNPEIACGDVVPAP
jgi:hypothetical protein